jgi:hypothetical protein
MCEGWNSKFFNLVGHAYLSIWRVIEWCQKEEATVRTIIQQDAVGNLNHSDMMMNIQTLNISSLKL